MRRGSSISRKFGRSMEMVISADSVTDAMEVLQKQIERLWGHNGS